MRLIRQIVESTCPTSGAISCPTAKMSSGAESKNVRVDWYECDHGHITLTMRHEWSA